MAKYERALLPGTSLQGGEYSYRIDRVLGQGSFGITYLAYAKVTIGGKLGKLQGEMPVAVKEFFMRDINGREGSTVALGSEGGLFDKYKHKFSREARNLAGLDHPGIVKVLETFESNGTSYYSMEYCGGGSLDALIAGRGCLPQDEALKYFGQIADALGYMHGRHMLHLDMKPGNVMLRTSGEAVLIDFGLSKQYDDDGVPESSTTIGGGTPGYAPIEQTNYKEGDGSGHLPVTMDIYALGATLYKMLTGERPPVASDVLVNFPEKPLRDHGVSDEVVAAIRRAMQPIPANRYQSVADFAKALQHNVPATDISVESTVISRPAIKRQPVSVTPPPVPHAEEEEEEEESERKGRSKGFGIGLTIAAVCIVVIGAVLLWGRYATNSSVDETSYLIEEKQDSKASAYAEDEKLVIEVANEWNMCHQMRDAYKLASLYASEVDYYHQKYTPKRIQESKDGLFMEYPQFWQDIYGIECVVGLDGTAKVSFSKEVVTEQAGETKVYPSYLCMEKINGRWLITTESDEVTDANIEKRMRRASRRQ